MREIRRRVAHNYATSWLGRPYRWGGDDPSGIDCSGLVIEILQGVGLLPHGWDGTAQMIHDYFKRFVLNHDEPLPGALVFYQNAAGLITHVGMIISSGLVLQAGGGGSSTQTPEDAWKQNAFVKIRPIDYRPERRILVDPFLLFPSSD